MKKNMGKLRRKVFFLLILLGVISTAIFCSFMSSYKQVNEKLKEKEELTLQYKELTDEQEMLEKEVIKMQDPEYIARYVREKYMYSKEGELILRISE